MGLFDIFTGDPYKQAAEQQRNYLQGVQNQVAGTIGNAQAGGLAALQSGQAGALGAVGGGTTQARADINQFAPAALGAISGGTDAARAALLGGQAGGLGALSGGVNAAMGAYGPLANVSTQYAGFGTDAAQAQRDALGLNGPEGIARSRQAFQTTPGYDFAKNQAIEGATRGFNTAGGALGGNTLAALSDLVGNQIAPSQWNQYMTGLSGQQSLFAPLGVQGLGTAAGGTANAALTGGTGAANIYTGTGSRLADLESGAGRAEAGVLTGQGQSLADLASKGGLAESNIFQTGGQNVANLLAGLSGQQVGSLGQLAPGYSNTYQTAAAGEVGGSKNLWNLISGLGSFAAGTPFGSKALGSVGLA